MFPPLARYDNVTQGFPVDPHATPRAPHQLSRGRASSQAESARRPEVVSWQAGSPSEHRIELWRLEGERWDLIVAGAGERVTLAPIDCAIEVSGLYAAASEPA